MSMIFNGSIVALHKSSFKASNALRSVSPKGIRSETRFDVNSVSGFAIKEYCGIYLRKKNHENLTLVSAVFLFAVLLTYELTKFYMDPLAFYLIQ